jgi:hypothetical protein
MDPKDDARRGFRDGKEFEKANPGLFVGGIYDAIRTAAGFVAIGTDPARYEAGFNAGREHQRRREEKFQRAGRSNNQRVISDGAGGSSNSTTELGPFGRFIVKLLTPFPFLPPTIRLGIGLTIVYVLWVSVSVAGVYLAKWLVSDGAHPVFWLPAIIICIACLPGVLAGAIPVLLILLISR